MDAHQSGLEHPVKPMQTPVIPSVADEKPPNALSTDALSVTPLTARALLSHVKALNAQLDHLQELNANPTPCSVFQNHATSPWILSYHKITDDDVRHYQTSISMKLPYHTLVKNTTIRGYVVVAVANHFKELAACVETVTHLSAQGAITDTRAQEILQHVPPACLSLFALKAGVAALKTKRTSSAPHSSASTPASLQSPNRFATPRKSPSPHPEFTARGDGILQTAKEVNIPKTFLIQLKDYLNLCAVSLVFSAKSLLGPEQANTLLNHIDRRSNVMLLVHTKTPKVFVGAFCGLPLKRGSKVTGDPALMLFFVVNGLFIMTPKKQETSGVELKQTVGQGAQTFISVVGGFDIGFIKVSILDMFQCAVTFHSKLFQNFAFHTDYTPQGHPIKAGSFFDVPRIDVLQWT